MKKEFKKVTTGVFDRLGRDNIPAQIFYMTMAAILFYGLIGTAIIAHYTIQSGYMPGILMRILLALVLPLMGVIIVVNVRKLGTTFIGYNMIIIPFGLVIAPTLHQYLPNVITNVFGMTAGITLVLGIIGAFVYPNFFSNRTLTLVLVASLLLVVKITQMFGAELHISSFDYVCASVFSLYIGYYMHCAFKIQNTIQNALDICADLYLDSINICLLGITGIFKIRIE